MEVKNLLKFSDLPVSRTTAWRLIRKGKLRCYRIGRRVFFSPEHVAELLRNSEISHQEVNKSRRNKY